MPHPSEHSPARRPLDAEEAQLLAERLSAFAAASRVRLLYALIDGELAVEELATATGLTPNSTSQQLRQLRHLRLVTARRDGRAVHYRLHDAHVVDLLEAVRHHHEHTLRGWAEGSAGARADVAAMPRS